jgi:N,N'-diacetyllegionaminate synthase
MSFMIGKRVVGPSEPPFIVLEAGINHNGEVEKARHMIRVAKAAGADAVKFQTFKAEEFVGNPDQMFTYKSQGKEVTESMLEMFRRYEFTPEEWHTIKAACDEEGILFLSTPQNVSDLELLLQIGVPMVKVGSDDFTNLPLLKRYSEAGLPMMISCGMADMSEISDALEATQAMEGKPVILMLCTSQYPTPPKDVNLAKLKTLAGAFPGLSLGFSDHSQGYWAATMAVGLGAVAFEKHFTLDRGLPGPDHWFSEDPESAAEWVSAIRIAKSMLGSPVLAPTESERQMRVLARRSVTSLRDIASGEFLTPENVGLRRPGSGLAPKFLEVFLGQRAKNSISKGEQLTFGMME